MRRHETHSSDAAAGHSTRARSLPASLQAQAGNQAVTGLLAPRSVQRSPAILPQDRDYWSEKGPKQLDRQFRPSAGKVAPAADSGFVPEPSWESKDALDLGYGGTGDATFQPDVRNDGGAHSGGLREVLPAHEGWDPYHGDLPIPPVGLPVPGGDDSGWFEGATGAASGALAGAAGAGGDVGGPLAGMPSLIDQFPFNARKN